MTGSVAPRPASWSSKEAGRPDLWRHVFGNTTGAPDDNGKPTTVYLAVWSGLRVPGQQALDDVRTSYFEWPGRSLDARRRLAHESDNGREAYFCAHLLTRKRRIKENAALMLAAYVDGDGAQPGPDLPSPTAVVESSPGRQQFYWRFTEAIDPTRGEQISKRLAYAMGADKSGWDLTQVLRGPGCRNWKYTPAPRVEIISIDDDRAYDPDELERILPELPVEAAPRAEVKLERSAAATPIGDRDQRARERMYAAKRGSEIQMLAGGGSVRSKPEGGADVSGDDQSYANALAFWFDKDPSRMAAEMWRSNRIRDKWSEVHSAKGETYLEMTIGTAISGCSQSFRDLTGYDAGEDPPRINWFTKPEQTPTPDKPVEQTTQGDPTTLDEALIIIAQQHQEIAEYQQSLRDVVIHVEHLAGLEEDRQTIIRTQRERLDVLEDIVHSIDNVLNRPNEEMSASDKVVLIATARWLPFYRSKQEANGKPKTIAMGYVAKVCGSSKSTVSSTFKRFSSKDADDGAPFFKRVTRVKNDDPDGPPVISEMEIMPWGERPSETLRAAISYAKAHPRPKHGGSQEASDKRWGRCSVEEHDNDRVRIKGYCPECGEVVGERIVTIAEFDALNEQVAHSEDTPPAVEENGYLIGKQLAHSAHVPPCPERQNVQVVDSAPPRSLLDYAASRSEERPKRCPAPSCRAMEFNPRPDGSWRCAKSGHDPAAYELDPIAVSGGSE